MVMTKFPALFVFILLVMTMLACGLSVPVTSPTATKTPAKLVMTINTPVVVSVTALRSLNVRSRPGHDKPVLGYFYNGNPVVMTGDCSRGWAEIVWMDGAAWVNARYLSSNKCRER